MLFSPALPYRLTPFDFLSTSLKEHSPTHGHGCTPLMLLKAQGTSYAMRQAEAEADCSDEPGYTGISRGNML